MPVDKGSQGAQRIHNPMFRRLLTLKEAAIYLGRSVWGIRELIWAGELPVVKGAGRGTKQYIDVNDLDAYVNRNKISYSR
jgi:excisionase family DNA binding protein